MKRILSKGKIIVSLVSVLAILAVSLLSMFTGVSFLASAEGEDEETVVTYPLNGTYDADYVEINTPGISYEAVDLSKKTVVDSFTGFDVNFCIDPNTEGNGTSGAPFVIKTANQFAAVVTGNLKDANGQWIDTEGLSFMIADNIRGFNLNNTGSDVDFSKDDLTAAKVEEALKDANVPTELVWQNSSGIPFKGRFDGNGACVYGLKGTAGYSAIFPKIGGNITVKNLTVKNCYFTGNNVSAFFGANTNPGKSSTFNTKHFMYNCQAYGNVLVCKFNTDEALQKCGVLIGQTEWPTESNLIVTDCLVYGNIAKHAENGNGKYDIEYGLVGNLHRNFSLTINNSIIMDSAPHALYYGSNAHLTSSYNNLYTNKMGIEPWENVDTTKNGVTYTYIYGYVLNGSTPQVKFDRTVNGISNVNGGNGYDRVLSSSIVYKKSAAEIAAASELDGISSEKWTYNANSYPTPKVYKIREYSAGTAWSGEVAVQFGEGDGTSGAPYTVACAEEFALMLTQPETGAHYRLTADIIINDTDVENWTANARKWFTSNDVPTFEASLDGAGFTVRGIYYDGSHKGEFAGLIPVVGDTAVISNVKVADSYIKADNGAAGAIAGAVADKCSKLVKFETCTVESSVKMEGAAALGGMIGKIGYSAVSISDCISFSNGLFDNATGEAKVKRAVSVGAYPFANIQNVRATDVYTDTDGATLEGVTVLPADAMQGEGAANNMPGLNFPTSWKTTDSYPAPTGVAASAEGEVGEPWSGGIATGFASGSGTEGDPYMIETPEQLAYFITKVKRSDGVMKYYQLGADIYLNDVNSRLWEEKIGCIDWFDQYVNYNQHAWLDFNGDGYVIHGLYIDTTKSTGAYVRAGLFPMLGQNTTIRNLGLSNVYMNGRTNDANYRDVMGAFVGCVEDFDKVMGFDSHDAAGNLVKLQDPELGYEEMAPKIKNCFVDHRSYISSYCTGGFFGEPYSAPILENCIFTGTITGNTDTYYTGIFAGCDSTYGTQLRGCISFPVGGVTKITGGSCGASWRSSPIYWCTYADPVYYFSTSLSYGGDFNKLSDPNDRIGDDAEAAMPLLDWKNTWRTVDGGTPVLMIFDKHRTPENLADGTRVSVATEYFSLTDYTPPSTALTFSTGDPDNTIDPIIAPMYSALTLPTITRPGYEFLGWFVYEDPAILYDLGYQPPRDLTLYAGWKRVGVVQPFDEYPNSIWDIDTDYWALNQPGVKGGYKNEYVRNGSKSMHLLGVTSDPVDCLLNYEQMLEPGKSYTMTFWVTTDKANNPATLLSLVHNSKPDYLNSSVAVENMAVATGLKVGEWVQYSYSFTALTKWVSLRATGAASLWFDDVVIAELDGTLEGGKYVYLNGNAAAGGSLSPNTGDAVSVAVLISAIMACAVIAVVSRKNLVEIVED